MCMFDLCRCRSGVAGSGAEERAVQSGGLHVCWSGQTRTPHYQHGDRQGRGEVCLHILPIAVNGIMLQYVCRYVLLVSGLCLGSSWCDQLSVEMLVDYVTGQLGGGKVREDCCWY